MENKNKVIERFEKTKKNKNKVFNFIISAVSVIVIAGFIYNMCEYSANNTKLQNELEATKLELSEKQKILEDLGYEYDLLNCPLCGYEVDIKPVNNSFYIVCNKFDKGKEGCGLRTDFYDSKNELIEIWNSMEIRGD